MFIPKVVCCGRPMKPVKNGVTAEALASGRPYYKVRCDRYGCSSCGTEVLTGFAPEALAENWERERYAGIAASVSFELN